MTRAEWYQNRHGGCWRKARTKKTCSRVAYCGGRIEEGDEFFDTNDKDHNARNKHATKALCKTCAIQEVKP